MNNKKIITLLFAALATSCKAPAEDPSSLKVFYGNIDENDEYKESVFLYMNSIELCSGTVVGKM